MDLFTRNAAIIPNWYMRSQYLTGIKMKVFSLRLLQLRKAAKMNQIEFAKKLGFGQGPYCRYETGAREPTFETLCHIADVLGVSTDWLLGRASIPTAPDRLAQISSDLDDAAAAANDAADRDSAG